MKIQGFKEGTNPEPETALNTYVKEQVKTILENFKKDIPTTFSSDGSKEIALLKKGIPFPRVMDTLKSKLLELEGGELQIISKTGRDVSGMSSKAVMQCTFTVTKKSP